MLITINEVLYTVAGGLLLILAKSLLFNEEKSKLLKKAESEVLHELDTNKTLIIILRGALDYYKTKENTDDFIHMLFNVTKEVNKFPIDRKWHLYKDNLKLSNYIDYFMESYGVLQSLSESINNLNKENIETAKKTSEDFDISLETAKRVLNKEDLWS